MHRLYLDNIGEPLRASRRWERGQGYPSTVSSSQPELVLLSGRGCGLNWPLCLG